MTSMTHTEYEDRKNEILCGYFNSINEWDHFEQDIIGYESTVEASKALDTLVFELIGKDEASKARPDKLKQSPPWQRNQLRNNLRSIITGKE